MSGVGAAAAVVTVTGRMLRQMVVTGLILSLTFHFLAASASPEVEELSGEADFRSVKLHWRYHGDPSQLRLFLINYCEDQPWGKYRCKDMMLEEREARQIKLPGAKQQQFQVEVKGLRMATNYTMEVTPVLRGDALSPARHPGSEVAVRTKGFSARAIQCLANSSVVEVETGPNFGGKVSVEGSEDPRCWTEGRRETGQTRYLLTIDHEVCGSEVHNTSVTTFIIVQENLPILTHSTRRFLVKCNYIPETFTVRAGVSLPNDDDGDEDLSPVDQAIFELDPSELFDSANNIFDSRLSEDIGRALRMSAEEENKEPQMWAHLVLMVILVMAAVVGLACAAWHFISHSRAQSRQGFMSPQEEPRVLQENESLEAVVRDYGRSDAGQECVGQPVALTSFLAGLELQTGEVYDLSHDSLPDDPLHHPLDLPDHLPSEGLACAPDSALDDPFDDLHLGLASDPPPQDEVNDFDDSYPDDSQDFDIHGSNDDDPSFPVGFVVPVETFNPLAHPNDGDNDLLVTYDLPCRNETVMVVLEPQTIPHLPPLIPHLPHPSLPHLPHLSHSSLPHHSPSLSLPDLHHLDLTDNLSFHPAEYSEDEVFLSQEEEEELEKEEGGEEKVLYVNCLPGGPSSPLPAPLPPPPAPLSRSRRPSLDTNWRLSDGEGQFFPSFSQ